MSGRCKAESRRSRSRIAPAKRSLIVSKTRPSNHGPGKRDQVVEALGGIVAQGAHLSNEETSLEQQDSGSGPIGLVGPVEPTDCPVAKPGNWKLGNTTIAKQPLDRTVKGALSLALAAGYIGETGNE